MRPASPVGLCFDGGFQPITISGLPVMAASLAIFTESEVTITA